MDVQKLITIDDELWNKFRKKCMMSDKTVKVAVNEIITKFVEGTQ